MRYPPAALVILLTTLGLMILSVRTEPALAGPVTCPPDTASSPALAPGATPLFPAPGANLILNGDFENNYFYVRGCHFNLSNTTVSNAMVNVKAFGRANEIDVMNDSTSCSYAGPPQSGITKLAIVGRPDGQGGDEIAFDISPPVAFGNAYTVTFYAWCGVTSNPNIGAVEIGLSSSASAFGTSVFSGVPATNGWTLLTTTFIAPVNAAFMTVRVDPTTVGWVHIDNFSLVAGGATPVAQRTWGKLKDRYRE
jgi:hypothetical protein